MSEDKVTRVIREDEVKEWRKEVKADMAALREQVQRTTEETGVKLEERDDDYAKAVESVDALQKKMEIVEKSHQAHQFQSTFGSGSGELKDCLQSFGGGFDEFSDNQDKGGIIERAIGSKPTIKNLVEGVFRKSAHVHGASTFHNPKHEAIQILQKASDDLYCVDAMVRMGMDSNELQAYNRAGGFKSLKTYKRFEATCKDFSKAADDLIDTTNDVSNWIAVQMSANMTELVKIGLPLLNMFPEINMPTATFELPTKLNDSEATRVTEVTTTTSQSPWDDTVTVQGASGTDWNDGKVILVAEKLRSRYWASAEAEEDTIVTLLPLINAEHVRNIGEAIEDALLNGQVSGLDTGGTHFTKANPSVSTDARDCWDGLRKFASLGGARASAGGSDATVVAMRGVRAGMGEFGVDPSQLAWIFGIFGFVSLLDDSNVLTIDKFGPNATVTTGTLAMVDGTEIVVSRRMPENLDTTGVIDGATATRTTSVIIHKNSVILGNRRRITLAQQNHINMDSVELVAFWRGDFQPMFAPATFDLASELYNTPNS